MRLITLFFLFLNYSLLAQTDFDTAKKLFNQKKILEAKPLFESYLKSNPNDIASMEYLGDIAAQQKKWDEAIVQFKTLKNQFPKSSTYWYKYGGALGMKAKNCNKFKALGMIDEIETSFLNAAKLDLKSTDARWALVMLYVELPGIIGGSETKAQKYTNEIMNISKVDGFLAKGYIDEYFNRNKKAEINYIKAHEIGNSKTTFQKLYNLYLNKIKDQTKAQKLKEQFEK